MVPLARHSANVRIDFLGLFTRLLIHVKASNVSYKLSLDYSNSHLAPDSNADLKGTSSNVRLLHTLRQPVVSLHFAILLPEVRGDHSMRGGLAKKDLA